MHTPNRQLVCEQYPQSATAGSDAVSASRTALELLCLRELIVSLAMYVTVTCDPLLFSQEHCYFCISAVV